jgi:membrane protease YdiL (CAAX protease family)
MRDGGAPLSPDPMRPDSGVADERKPLRSFAAKQPVLFSVVTTLAYILVLLVFLTIFEVARARPLLSSAIVHVFACGLVIVLISYMRWWRDCGFTRPVSDRTFVAYLPWLLLLMLISAGPKSAGVPFRTVAIFAFLTLAVGLAEEGVFRGVVLRALLPRGTWFAVILSSVLFGLGHMIHTLIGASVGPTVVEVIFAMLIGVGLAGARLYGGQILPAVVIHAVIDFEGGAHIGYKVQRMTAGIPPSLAIAPIVLAAVYAAYGLLLVRRLRRSGEPTLP